MRKSVSARLCLAWLLFSGTALAQERPAPEKLSLRQAFDIAWARQPAARGGELRRAAADARRDAAGNWLVAAPSLEMSAKSDRANNNEGKREYDVGVGLPLWLPGERGSTQALADAERDALNSRLLAAQLRLSSVLREAWWSAALAAVEVEVAQARARNAEQLAGDVARRVKAGDLSRADQHQADGAVATAQALLAEAQSAQTAADQRVRALLGVPARVAESATPERMPAAALDEAQHPALREIADRAEASRKAKALAQTQTRANPQLTLSTTRERGAYGDAYDQSITVGLRIPFGADNRQRARIVTAEAEALEAEAQLDYEREQVLSGLDAARARVDGAQTQLAAAERRARLARETRGFFEKSFRYGESDLPTRLRVELEAYEAERQYARSRIVAAQAISQLRQALGLLPE
ncbi:MAG: TolC family protein [Rhodocyclaceae bacterium]|nr:TolC family protein [Rhodocyclaceae bacterium]